MNVKVYVPADGAMELVDRGATVVDDDEGAGLETQVSR